MKPGSVQMICIVGAIGGGLLTGSSAAGAEFTWQLAGAHGQDDAAGIVESAHWTLSATYYASPVDDENGPYILAPFLDRSSYVAVGLWQARQENVLVGLHGGSTGFIRRLQELYGRSTTETLEPSVSGRYVWAGSGWYVGGGAERSNTDERPSMRDMESSGYRVVAGKYLGGSTTLDLTLGVTREMQEPEEVVCQVLSGSCFGFGGSDIDTEEAALAVRHVGALWGDTYSVSARVQSSRSDVGYIPARLLGLETFPGTPAASPGTGVAASGDPLYTEKHRAYFLSGEWFPRVTLGVRLSYARVKQEMLPGNEGLGLSGSWFFRRNVAAQVSFTRTRSDVPPEFRFRYSDTASVRLLGRF